MEQVHCEKVSVFGVILVRIQSECGKMQIRKTLSTDIFQAVVHIRKTHAQCHRCHKKETRYNVSVTVVG